MPKGRPAAYKTKTKKPAKGLGTKRKKASPRKKKK